MEVDSVSEVFTLTAEQIKPALEMGSVLDTGCCRRPKVDPWGVRRNSWTTWR